MDTLGALSNLHILLVDDEPFIRRTTAHVLSNSMTNKVMEAGNGLEAISTLNESEVDLIITDIQMPKMNGIELIKQIRLGNTSAKRDLRTIVVTSYSNTEVLGSCIALDINGFLVKPITIKSAIDKIKVAMREQVDLQEVDAYEQVKTDIKSLAESVTAEKSSVNASILRDRKFNESSQSQPVGKSVTLSLLTPGMQLLGDLHTESGIKLVSAGQVLNEGLINRVKELAKVIETQVVQVK